MPVGAVIEMALDADGLHTDFAQRLRDRLGEAWSRARTTMGENARTQKQNYDRKIFGEPYKVGDRVWYFNMRKKKGECPKLKRRWLGPFEVKDVLSAVTYRRQEGKRKQLVVHYDRLKPCQDKKTEGVSSCNTLVTATNARKREGHPGRGQ